MFFSHSGTHVSLFNGAAWEWKLPEPGITSHTNWLRYSSTVVYLTSGYSSEASTPNDVLISKLVWSPLTKTEWQNANITLSGTEASARNRGKPSIWRHLPSLKHQLYEQSLGPKNGLCGKKIILCRNLP